MRRGMNHSNEARGKRWEEYLCLLWTADSMFPFLLPPSSLLTHFSRVAVFAVVYEQQVINDVLVGQSREDIVRDHGHKRRNVCN
jgi:hypothetical protein